MKAKLTMASTCPEIGEGGRANKAFEEREAGTHVFPGEGEGRGEYQRVVSLFFILPSNIQFNDILIYASSIAPAGLTYRVLSRIPLDGMRVTTLDDPEIMHGFVIISTCKSFRLEAR